MSARMTFFRSFSLAMIALTPNLLAAGAVLGGMGFPQDPARFGPGDHVAQFGRCGAGRQGEQGGGGNRQGLAHENPS